VSIAKSHHKEVLRLLSSESSMKAADLSKRDKAADDGETVTENQMKVPI
jgi:phosphopentomutase